MITKPNRRTAFQLFAAAVTAQFTQTQDGYLRLTKATRFRWVLDKDVAYEVELDGEILTFTAKEIFEALKP